MPTARARLPRAVHPGAWWLWALGLATAATRTTNPLLLALIIAVAAHVVAARRTDAPWALGFRLYLWLGALIVSSRILFRVIFGGGQGDHILITLPQLPLPEWAAGIRLLGPVAAEQLLGGAYDGLRLAAMVICLGAANALANPKQLLRAVPGALYEVGTAVVVALSVAPQLVESVLRVRRARRLRGAPRSGMRALRGIVIPVLTDALDRSLALAAAMDSRGYGRHGNQPSAVHALTGALMLGGLCGICVGMYALMDATTPRYLGAPMLATGALLAAAGLAISGRRVLRTTYRPDRFGAAEVLVAACGIAAAAGLYLTTRIDPADLYPSLNPLRWPQIAPLPAVAILIGGLPAWLAPPPPETHPAGPVTTSAEVHDEPGRSPAAAGERPR
ncbi:CbiQ family ECF transporter T component [Solwaraspora sp. WMMD1047]|uniref:CbiQ family ECF transporter T component n=1 Tax=Solwaraspora sp. WMMD1047 TaxID=3016102 RepID=UPI00241803EC|nr:CbiQ family ECF transporter T component [Solwaraspora sp. WMMD1047]MDG4833969.1 CbiQ family ECF transporter T component [Solwaraspora sp. WMMD1047]